MPQSEFARIQRVNDLQILLAALFVSAAGLNAVANWLKVPYPIPLVIGGLVLGLVPGIPDIQLDPDLVLLVFLPPLLYSSAFFYDLRALRDDARVIALNAIGLVARDGGGRRGGRPRGDRPALGDVLRARRDRLADRPGGRDGDHAAGRRAAPDGQHPRGREPDQRRDRAGHLQGRGRGGDRRERLGRRTPCSSSSATPPAGIAIGLAVGWVIAEIRKRVTDVNTELTISLFSAYGAFIPADQLGVSGVLAVVACGVYLGFRAPEIASPESRMQGYAMWSILTFLLNAALFILIGLQLPAIVDGLARPAGRRGGRLRGGRLRGGDRDALRLELRRSPSSSGRSTGARRSARGARSWRIRVVGGWAGMRGAVSLAAALALPLHTDAGAPLPGRDLIQFITFSLILVTVVGQGLTLPWLIRRLGVVEDGTEEESEELRARLVIARAALERVDELEGEEWTRDGTIERVRALYEFRQRRFKVRAGKIEDDGRHRGALARLPAADARDLRRPAAGAGRLRNSREISAEVMRRVERELDLEESRLEV